MVCNECLLIVSVKNAKVYTFKLKETALDQMGEPKSLNEKKIYDEELTGPNS